MIFFFFPPHEFGNGSGSSHTPLGQVSFSQISKCLQQDKSQKLFGGPATLLVTPPVSLHPLDILKPECHICLLSGVEGGWQFEMWSLPQFLQSLLCHLPPLEWLFPEIQ